MRWVRPGDFSRDPDYFKDLTSVVVPGRMNDLWLAGAMAAVAAHPDALVENIFGSSPDDFKQFGVYTCRLYKNGKWVEVVCDTRLPCAPPLGGKKVEGLKAASSPCPITARSANAAEQWIPLLEKAVAKYHGSYEALNGGDVGEALVDLTGGSTETIELAAPEIQAWVESGRLWDLLELYVADAHICTALVEDKTVSVATDGNTELPASEGTGLFPNAAYSVVMVKHIVGFDLVRLACPWSSAMETRGHWTGDWSDDSTKWDDFPEVAETLRDDADSSFGFSNLRMVGAREAFAVGGGVTVTRSASSPATRTDTDEGGPRHCETSVKPVPSLDLPAGQALQAWEEALA